MARKPKRTREISLRAGEARKPARAQVHEDEKPQQWLRQNPRCPVALTIVSAIAALQLIETGVAELKGLLLELLRSS